MTDVHMGIGLDKGTPATAKSPPAQPKPVPSGLSERALGVAGRLGERTISPVILSGLVALGEFAGTALLGIAIWAGYVNDPGVPAFDYIAACLAVTALTSVIVQSIDGYQIPAFRHHVPTVARMWLAWTAVFALFALFSFFAKLGDSFSRVWLASWYVSGALGMAVGRTVLSSFVRRWTREGRLERRAVVVGGGRAGEELIRSLEAQPDSDIRIVGVFDDRSDERSPQNVAGYPKLGTVAELVEFGRLTKLDMLIVTLPITAEKRVLELLKKLWVLPVDIRLSAHSHQLRFRPRSYSYVGTIPFIDVLDKPLADWDSVTKRGFDLFFGMLALIALSPLMIGAAIAIKLDSKGPVFFRQKRYGFNNELIDVWKFRSMYVENSDHAAARLVTKGDPRVTRVGRFIRKASIDELPQLFNVIMGELSLVGPRPHALSAKAENRLYEQVVDGYFARHRVKPGVTGWAQINGWRGETDTSEKIEKRVECDLYYIENWSLSLDLYILFATPFRLLDTENAY